MAACATRFRFGHPLESKLGAGLPQKLRKAHTQMRPSQSNLQEGATDLCRALFVTLVPLVTCAAGAHRQSFDLHIAQSGVAMQGAEIQSKSEVSANGGVRSGRILLPQRVRCPWQCAMPVPRARASEQARESTSPKKNKCDKQVSSWRHISCHTDKNRYYT